MVSKFFKNSNPTIEHLEKILLDKGFSVEDAEDTFDSKKMDLDQVNQNGNTLLHICLKNNKFKAASWLVEKGANLSLQNKSRITPVRIAVEKGNALVINSIVKHGDININQVDGNGRSLLQDAVIMGNHAVAELLIENSIDVNIKDRLNRNVAFDAVAYGDDKIIDKIITMDGLDLNVIDANGNTLLHDPRVLEDDELAAKLLKNGADPTICNSKGMNFLTHTALKGKAGEAMLQVALSHEGDFKSKTTSNNSILMEVMFSFARISKGESDRRDGLKDIAKTLIKHGLEIDAINNDGETSLFDMVKTQDIEGCAFLLEHKVDVNKVNKRYETALSIAILKGIENLDMIVLLMQYGADPTIKNKHNQTVPEILNNIILHVHNLKKLKDHEILNKISPTGNYMLILKEILEVDSFDYSYMDSTGNPLFFIPFLYGDLKTSKLYLKHGLDINVNNNHGHNIFYEYVLKIFQAGKYFNAFRERLVFLLVNEVNIDVVNSHGQNIYTKVALIPNCNLKLFRKVIEVTRHNYNSVDNLGRTIIHSCVWSNNIDLLKLVYGVERNTQNIADNFNILPITYAALLGNKDIVIEFLRRDIVITSRKDIVKAAKEKFQPLLKNLDKLTVDVEDKDFLRKIGILQEQVRKDLTL